MNNLTIVFVLFALIAVAVVHGTSEVYTRVTHFRPYAEQNPFNSTQSNTRIINGNTAYKNQFPYQVGIEIYVPAGYTWCGGSIISMNYVLTAAHCVDTAIWVKVLFGAHDRQDAYESGRKNVRVDSANFIVHSGWKNLEHDIALIRLPQPIQYTGQILPISLPLRAHQKVNFENNVAVATGWGYMTGTSYLARYLQYTEIKVQNQNVCKGFLSPWVRDTNICVDGSTGKGGCYGDSGSPLVTTGGVRYVIGIASFIGYDGCEAGWPTVYTRVSSYLDWISAQTGIPIY